MPYRRLGGSGLRLSLLSFGSWVTFGSQLDRSLARECMAAARDSGVNFFDNAEAYGGGESETIMGAVLKELGWPRESYVVSSKFYWGLSDTVNAHHTLNRKYLLDAVEGSLRRFGLEYLDLVFCHRADPETPVEETVFAMHDMVSRGRALYWGTSEWPADAIRAAWDIADRHHLHKPVTEQPQYNLLERTRVEQEYARLCDELGIGLTTWSPLASGLLTGKYASGVPAGSRASLPGYEWLRQHLTDPKANTAVRQLAEVARDLEVSLAQLAIAWCTLNPHVTTVITGASRPQQVVENMGALDVLKRITPEVAERLAAINV
ncbi:MAG TPA: aldo/keto reductase [Candidatus Binatia bacterium]|nr:aldo/keto reductase [Candidatus Binatia bacterium]